MFEQDALKQKGIIFIKISYIAVLLLLSLNPGLHNINSVHQSKKLYYKHYAKLQRKPPPPLIGCTKTRTNITEFSLCPTTRALYQHRLACSMALERTLLVF